MKVELSGFGYHALTHSHQNPVERLLDVPIDEHVLVIDAEENVLHANAERFLFAWVGHRPGCRQHLGKHPDVELETDDRAAHRLLELLLEGGPKTKK